MLFETYCATVRRRFLNVKWIGFTQTFSTRFSETSISVFYCLVWSCTEFSGLGPSLSLKLIMNFVYEYDPHLTVANLNYIMSAAQWIGSRHAPKSVYVHKIKSMTYYPLWANKDKENHDVFKHFSRKVWFQGRVLLIAIGCKRNDKQTRPDQNFYKGATHGPKLDQPKILRPEPKFIM